MHTVRIKKFAAVFGIAIAITAAAISARYFINNRAVMKNTEISRYTVVIDAGHGGMDGGASGESGVCEKNINLNIAKKLELLCGLFGVPSKMTRTDDISLDYTPGDSIRKNKSADLKARVKAAESVNNPMFISIHLNKFEQSRYKGAQTFYAGGSEYGKAAAELIQEELVSRLDKSNTRVAKPGDNSIYLFKSLKCPAIIVECGFLSNPEEEALLQQEQYQKNIAYSIINGYLRFLNI